MIKLRHKLLECKNVYEERKEKAIGKYYCDSKDIKEEKKAIISYFSTKNGEVIKTAFYTENQTDRIRIYFSNENNISDEECVEALIRGVCFQLNDNRKYLIRRTNNNEIEIIIHYRGFEQNNKYTDAVINHNMKGLGYQDLKYQNIKPDNYTKYEQERLLTEQPTGTKLYEEQRDDYLKWDEYFLASAMLASKRSKDPSTQVGCCIVNNDNIKLSEGYNGAPKGWKDSEFPWSRNGNDTKYPYVVHSEANAITHCIGQGMSLDGTRMYVTLFPCNECAKLIVQSGIKEVIYLSDKYADTPSTLASKRMFDECGITYRQLNPEKSIILKLKL